jgi:acyl-coenzyme A synthetase/AMP-(fatty) acid ligase
MYNFLISGLSLGCTLVLFDGSPLRDPALLWKLTDDLKISIFGTSAKYIEQLSVCLPFTTDFATSTHSYRKDTNLVINTI